jgi:hypothetical protein
MFRASLVALTPFPLTPKVLTSGTAVSQFAQFSKYVNPTNSEWFAALTSDRNVISRKQISDLTERNQLQTTPSAVASNSRI